MSTYEHDEHPVQRGVIRAEGADMSATNDASSAPRPGDGAGHGQDPNPISILVGQTLTRARGERVVCPRLPSAVVGELVVRQAQGLADSWVILGRFEEDHRSKDRWVAASGLLIDLDFEDPALPRDEGAHQPIPADLRTAAAEALSRFGENGFGYLTTRGLRWGGVFPADVTDVDAYEAAAQELSSRLLDHLRGAGLPLWREGVPGFRYDSSSEKPSQPMRVPLPRAEIVLTGANWPIKPIAQQGGTAPRLSVRADLPGQFGEACEQVARWVQIAVEVVVTNLMAMVSAAIGNSRTVEARGIRVPLSLHYLTALSSGSGKGTVRKLMRQATEEIRKAVAEHRKKAQREEQDYENSLAAWKSAQRSKKGGGEEGKRRGVIPRPEPPTPSPLGGPRATFVISEGTLEGVIDTLMDSPRGLLWSSDEAQEVLGALGRYGDTGARSLDAARLRRLMESEPVEMHRSKSNICGVRSLQRPFLSIDADVQPEIFERIFEDEDRVSGLTARLLVHAPPAMQGTRRYLSPPPEPEPWVLKLFRKQLKALWDVALELEDGVPSPKPLPLSAEADRLWAEELEGLERQYATASEEEVGLLGHARGRILRLAGVLALMGDHQAKFVTGEDMRRGIAHMRYHLDQHRWLASESHNSESRLERLREQAMRIFEGQRETGVRPSDLRNNVNKVRYGGAEGEQRALADLHALGWELRRPATPKGRRGRKPVVAFFPPGPIGQSAKSARPRDPRGAADSADCPTGEAGGGTNASELLEEASARLLGGGQVELPTSGRRVVCPACGSPDGLGALPGESSRWYCHSDRHSGQRWGSAVDYLLAERLGRMPSVEEALEEAKVILGVLRGEGRAGPRQADPVGGEPHGPEGDPAMAELFPTYDPAALWEDDGGRP